MPPRRPAGPGGSDAHRSVAFPSPTARPDHRFAPGLHGYKRLALVRNTREYHQKINVAVRARIAARLRTEKEYLQRLKTGDKTFHDFRNPVRSRSPPIAPRTPLHVPTTRDSAPVFYHATPGSTNCQVAGPRALSPGESPSDPETE